MSMRMRGWLGLKRNRSLGFRVVGGFSYDTIRDDSYENLFSLSPAVVVYILYFFILDFSHKMDYFI